MHTVIVQQPITIEWMKEQRKKKTKEKKEQKEKKLRQMVNNIRHDY